MFIFLIHKIKKKIYFYEQLSIQKSYFQILVSKQKKKEKNLQDDFEIIYGRLEMFDRFLQKYSYDIQ